MQRLFSAGKIPVTCKGFTPGTARRRQRQRQLRLDDLGADARPVPAGVLIDAEAKRR